jgi:hypothetical protein
MVIMRGYASRVQRSGNDSWIAAGGKGKPGPYPQFRHAVHQTHLAHFPGPTLITAAATPLHVQ